MENNALRITQGSKRDNALKLISKESLRVLAQDHIYIDQPRKRDIINKQKACSGRHKDTAVIE